ncbi:MAG TPA: SPOR domain-containing protein [Rhodocyclaceae bacterium]|nr:SPOR domain-containing protein [Rhodocyclaceae bacterium]
MAETDVSSDTTHHDEEVLRHRLLRRIAIAGVSIISLVAGLAIFDANYVPDSPTAVMVSAPKPAEPAAPLPVSPEPPAPAVAETKPIEPEKVTEESKPADTKIAEAKPAETKPIDGKHGTDSKQTKTALATPPEMTSAPVMAPVREKPLTKPAVAQNVSTKPTNAGPIAPEPAKSLANSHAQPARPLSQMAQSEEANRKYLVQMGVFSNVSNAEELRAKLEKAGIPSQIEARVQVGPFATRAEAEAAQKKMTALGLNGLLVSARK